ncbi:hypothetical protein Cgig2_008622 [Carnegiea gigantea]|uniref:Endonuclease/exonuclease/phosphatase domain-containing protein n=1 Tax=Carnegiea gigantea TaxID=171969 RepID=A0A9Q1K1G1_9CARY|nr:hypothetical protein Cgig2_008622 [Carnegiea gigantea]
MGIFVLRVSFSQIYFYGLGLFLCCREGYVGRRFLALLGLSTAVNQSLAAGISPESCQLIVSTSFLRGHLGGEKNKAIVRKSQKGEEKSEPDQMNENRSKSDPNLSKSKVTTSRCLVVGNIHVLFNPNRGDVKLGQAHKLSEEWGGIPVVLAGDFNSLPQSALYQFISSAKLDLLQHDRKKISGQIDMALHRASFCCLIEELFRPQLVKLKLGSSKVRLIEAWRAHDPKFIRPELGQAYYKTGLTSQVAIHLGSPTP